MTTTLLFAFPATLLTVIFFFISCSLVQRKINYSLLSGALHKNSQRLNNLYGIGFYIFVLGSVLPSIFFLIFFKIEVNILMLGFLIILIPILKKTFDNNNLLISFLAYSLMSFVTIRLLNYQIDTIVDMSIIGFVLVLMLLLNYLLRKLFISEAKLLSFSAIFTFSICVLAIIIRDQPLFFINLTVFTSSSCLLFHNKLNKKHKILITQSGKSVILFFLVALGSYLLKSFL
jgi:hypothetical protein